MKNFVKPRLDFVTYRDIKDKSVLLIKASRTFRKTIMSITFDATKNGHHCEDRFFILERRIEFEYYHRRQRYSRTLFNHNFHVVGVETGKIYAPIHESILLNHKIKIYE